LPKRSRNSGDAASSGTIGSSIVSARARALGYAVIGDGEVISVFGRATACADWDEDSRDAELREGEGREGEEDGTEFEKHICGFCGFE